MKFVEESSQTIVKSLAKTLIANLATMKFNYSHSMHKCVVEMTNLVPRLKSLEFNVEEYFLV